LARQTVGQLEEDDGEEEDPGGIEDTTIVRGEPSDLSVNEGRYDIGDIVPKDAMRHAMVALKKLMDANFRLSGSDKVQAVNCLKWWIPYPLPPFVLETSTSRTYLRRGRFKRYCPSGKSCPTLQP
jgi:hypothetical protein